MDLINLFHFEHEKISFQKAAIWCIYFERSKIEPASILEYS